VGIVRRSEYGPAGLARPIINGPRKAFMHNIDMLFTWRRRWSAAVVVVLAALTLFGCRGSGVAHPVDPPRAREALKTALDAWKGGQTPDSIKSSSTPMTVQDFDWAGGARLIDYQILDDGKAKDANLSVRVKLVLDRPGATAGKAAEKTVWYLVTTSPSVTVFRDALRR
jgi:hypothetical protein